MPACSRTRSTRAAAAIDQPSSCASEAPRSWTAEASTTTARTPASVASRATATRSSSAASAGAPRLVPTAGAVSPRWSRNRRATATGSSAGSSTTGARSSSTPPSTAARSVSGPACSHSDVAPPSRSASASAFSCFASSPRSSTRTSRPPGAVGRALPPASTPDGPGSVAGVPSGLSGMPSRVVRVSFAHTASSGSSSPKPAGLPEDGGGRLLPVGPRRGGSLEGQRERALVGLQLGRLGEAALDASCGVMLRTLGAPRGPSHTL